MRKSAFKITVLVGIIGVGFWAILQAQNGLTGLDFSKNKEVKTPSTRDAKAPELLAKNAKKASPMPKDDTWEKDVDQKNPFAPESSKIKKVEATAFELKEKFSEQDDPFFKKQDDPFFKKQDQTSVAKVEPQKRKSGGIEFRDETLSAPFDPQKNAQASLPPWKGEERHKSDEPQEKEQLFDKFEKAEQKKPASVKISDQQPPLLFPESDAKEMPAPEKAGPQLVGFPDTKDQNNEDPFAEKSALETKPASQQSETEDPFGRFEEQKKEKPTQQLPLTIPNETEKNIFGDTTEEKITPLVLQEEKERSTIKQIPVKQPNLLQFTPEVGKRQPVESKDDDLIGDGIIGNQSIPRGAGRPQLTIRKIAPKNATLGKAMVYKIVVRNSGSTVARKVVVEDRIPKGSKLKGTIPRAEMSGKRLLWNLGSMKPSEEKTIQVQIIPTNAGQIGSVALVNFVSEVAAVTTVTAPKLVLTLTGPESTSIGEPVIYKFRLTNNGTAKAEDVIIRNLIPQGLKHPDGNDLEYEVGTLEVGKSEEIKLTVTATTEGTVTNKAIATAKGGFQEEASVKLIIEGPILSITRSGPKHRYLGRPAVFNNNVKNESRSTLQNVTVIEVLPDGFRFDKASAGGRYNNQTGEIIWKIDQLKSGETRRLSAIVVGDSAGKRTSVVKAYARNLLRAEVKSQTIVEGYPKLQALLAGVDAPIAEGEKVTYQIRINNSGTAQADNVKIMLSVPKQLEFVSARGAKIQQLQNGNIQVSTTQDISAKQGFVFYATFKAVSKGKGFVGVHAKGDHMSRSLTHDEEVRVYEN